jgi:hypothetical protein
MTIIEHLKAFGYWVMDKIRAAWLRLREQGIEARDNSLGTLGSFLTSPLSETEYALLKRVSGIMGTALAVYITLMAGIATALVVFGICLFLLYGLYKVAAQNQEQAQNLR